LTVDQVIGRNLKNLRRAAGLAQDDVAGAMRELGFRTWHRQTVSDAEAGRRQFSTEETIALASYFEMPLYALLVSAGMDLPGDPPAVGRRQLSWAEWIGLIQQDAPPAEQEHDGQKIVVLRSRWPQDPPGDSARRALDALADDLPRPWAQIWRERADRDDNADPHPARAFAEARESRLAIRSRHRGPIYVHTGDGPLSVSTTVPPWAQERYIELLPGVPYVARDEWEADRLSEAARSKGSTVRQIDRQEAYRLRKKGKKPHGTRTKG
jgi:transcriptional regulator with XRE-family HTH domain